MLLACVHARLDPGTIAVRAARGYGRGCRLESAPASQWSDAAVGRVRCAWLNDARFAAAVDRAPPVAACRGLRQSHPCVQVTDLTSVGRAPHVRVPRTARVAATIYHRGWQGDLLHRG